ncbi:MAG: hypothetical protein IKS94_10265 [Prevotella sp.]|nr:hypothetical protein [Prevotella sp.]
MRKRFYDERVCSCSPTQGVLYLDARLMRDIVNREIHPIRCASTCGNKAKRSLVVGDLCAEAGHPRWALKVWKLARWENYCTDCYDSLYAEKFDHGRNS